MKKFLMFLCLVIIFVGIVSCPLYDNQATKAAVSIAATTSQISGDEATPVSAPVALIVFGSALLWLARVGRKTYKK
jgi:nucleoside recognition membrane protein YjiH